MVLAPRLGERRPPALAFPRGQQRRGASGPLDDLAVGAAEEEEEAQENGTTAAGPTLWPTPWPTAAPSPKPTVALVWPPTPWPTGPTNAPTEAPTSPIKPDITYDMFKTTCTMAFVGFWVVFALYSVVRSQRGKLARKMYAPRMFTAHIPPRLQPRGVVGWFRSLVGRKASRRVLDEVGLDAFMMNRLLMFCGTAFLCLAPFATFVLFPLYASEAGEATGFKRYTIDSLLRSENPESQLWIAVGMTYWNSMVVLYLLHNEYKVYIHHRHEFLRRGAPQGYTVLVERIPKELCNRPALMHYFRKIFGKRVVAATVVDNNPVLNFAVKKRLQAVERLERARFELSRTGRRPWRLYLPWMCGQLKQKIEPLGISNDEVDVPEEQPAQAAGSGAFESAATVQSVANPGAGPPSAPSSDEDEDGDADADADGREDFDTDDDDGGGGGEGDHNVDPTTTAAAIIPGFGTERGERPPSPAATGPHLRHRAAQQSSQVDPARDAFGEPDDERQVEEEAFLRQWQHDMEGGLVSEHLASPNERESAAPAPTGTPRRPRRRRINYCLWFLAHLNICMYIDAIRSHERELRVWNRRVKRLQQKAERKRLQQEREALENVVEPSRNTIHEQVRVRLRHERRGRRAHARSSMSLRRRNSANMSDADSARGSVQSTMLSSAAAGRRHQHQRSQTQTQQALRGAGGAAEAPINTVSSLRSMPLPSSVGAERAERAADQSSSHGSVKSRSAASRLAVMPWDDSGTSLYHTLLSDGRYSSGNISEDGSADDDDSTFYFDEDDLSFGDIVGDGDELLFEHAGLDDILRYAVDQNERTSAFVTFSTLTVTMCAAQSVVDRPLKMSISIAPEARDVLWDNLGLPLPLLAMFTWLIRALELTLVLVFGTLTASLAALTNLNALVRVWPELRTWLNKHEDWVVVFQQITPLVMVILYNVVPPILNLLLKLQRRRSLSEVQVEFFRIYFHFLLIQVFLFYTVAGGLLQHMSEIINHPVQFLSLLGKALQSNELFFLQYLVVRCFLLSFDLLRVADLSIALLRGLFKRSRTARERRTPCCGWHTIDHPNGGNTERTLSTICLCFAIGLSYSVICPAMPLVALIYFGMATIVYRQQLLYVYTHERESAGALFPFAFRALLTGVIIFQLVMVGVFLVHNSPSSVTMLVPLIFITLTFLLFCENAYETPSRFLPLGDAAELDIINGPSKELGSHFKHPSTRAPSRLEPEPPDTDSFKQLRHPDL